MDGVQYDVVGIGEDQELISSETEDESDATFSGEELVSIYLHDHMGLNHTRFSILLVAGGFQVLWKLVSCNFTCK